MTEQKNSLQFQYRVNADDHGMVDGRTLAKDLMIDAFRAVATYGTPCMACAIELFQEAAGQALARVHEEYKENGMVPAIHYALPTNGNQDSSAFARHVYEMRKQIKAEGNGTCREHPTAKVR